MRKPVLKFTTKEYGAEVEISLGHHDGEAAAHDALKALFSEVGAIARVAESGVLGVVRPITRIDIALVARIRVER